MSDNPTEENDPALEPTSSRPVKKPRVKKTPEEIEAMKECRARKSIFGGTYDKSLPHEWKNFDGAGWVYLPMELHMLQDEYRQCEVSKKWFKANLMKYTEHGAWIESSRAEEYGYLWVEHGDYYFLKSSGKQVFSSSGKTILVSDSCFRNSYRKCDYTGHYWPKTLIMRVAEHSSYNYVCQDVYAKHFRQCQGCGNAYVKEIVVTRTDVSSKILCNRCYEKQLYGNVILSHDNKEYPKPLCSKQKRLGHVVKDGVIWATNKPMEVQVVRMFGAEVETEFSKKMAKAADVTRGRIAHNVRDTLGSDFVIIKEDGTLTMNGKYSESGDGALYAGFEVVTAPADLAVHRERWIRLEKSQFYPMLRAWDTETCGFHVHVSRAALSELQIGRMLVFINHKNNKKLVQLVAGRSEKKFTRYVPKNVTDVLHPERVINPDEEKSRDRARRVALNVSNPHTVEFRIFRGTINPKHILRNMEFCDAVCDFCLPCSRSMAEFSHPKHFVQFISDNRKKWPLLAEWMVAHELIKLKPLGDKANKQLVTLKPSEVQEGEDKTDEGLMKANGEKQKSGTLDYNSIYTSNITTSTISWADLETVHATLSPSTRKPKKQ